MTPDQYVRLKSLQDRLIDQFLEEGDPVNWPGHGTPIAEQTQKDRGDAVWCKKSAAATVSLAMRIGTLTQQHEGAPPPLGDPPGGEDDPEEAERAHERQVALVSREAEQFIDAVRRRAKG